MAVSAVVRKRGAVGDMQVRVVDLTLDNSYPTGGWPLTAKQLGLGQNGVVWMVILPELAGYAFEWDYVNSKLLAKQGGAAINSPQAEIPNLAAVLNAQVVRAVFLGQGAG